MVVLLFFVLGFVLGSMGMYSFGREQDRKYVELKTKYEPDEDL